MDGCTQCFTTAANLAKHLTKYHSMSRFSEGCATLMGLWRCPHCAVNLGSAGSHLSSGRCATAPRPTHTPAPAPPTVLLEASTLSTAYAATSAAIGAHIKWEMICNTDVSTTQYVPSSALFKTGFAAFFAHCSAQATDSNDNNAWLTVFALGKLLFGRVPGQPNTTRAETRARLDLILAGRVTENEVFVYWKSGMVGTGPNQRPVPDKIKRAEALVRAGELRKAMQVLTNLLTLPTDLSPEQTAKILAELKALHPEGTFTPEPPEPDPLATAGAPAPTPAHQQGEAPPPTVPIEASTVADIIKAVMSSAKLTAPGLSGFRPEHLQAVFGLKVGNVSGPIARLIQPVAAGKIPDGFDRDTAYGGLLTPLLKPNGRLRPIVVGDLFVRMGGRAIAAHYATKFAAFFNPKHQLGIATSAGAEAIIHAVRITLAANPSFVALQLDFTNAYNTVDRALIESELKAHFPALLPYFYARYGTRTKLFVPSLGADAWVWSECGVHQGDPLGPFFFALALNVILREATGAGSDAMDTSDLLPLILAYLDDIVIVGSIEAVAKLAAKLALCTVTTRSGLSLNPSKCACWSPTVMPEARRAALIAACETAQVPAAQLAPALIDQPSCETGGSILLGAPIGSDQFCKVTLEAATAATRVSMERLLELPSPQAQLLCLRYCASPRATATLRASPPTVTHNYAVSHDEAVTRTLETIQTFAISNNDIKKLTQLPINHGGMGLTSAVATAPLAYTASVADATRVAAALPNVFAPAASAIAACLTTPQVTWPQGVSTDLHTYLDTFTKTITEYRATHTNFAVSMVDDLKAIPQKPAPLSATQPHVQRRLAQLTADMTETMFRLSLSPAARALLISNQQYGAAAALFAIPSCPLFTMDADTIRHFLYNRLLVAVLTNSVNKCDSEHLFPEHCAKGDCHTVVHDITCKALSNCLQAMGDPVVTEQFKPYQATSGREHNERPDLDVTNFPAPNARALVEFGITSPTTLPNISAAQLTPLAAAHTYEREKTSKYIDLARDLNARVYPAIMETTGAMGRGLQDILAKGDEIVSPAWFDRTEDVRTFTARTFKQFHTQAIAVAFWGGSLQKLKAHDAAHRAEQVPSTTARLRDLGLTESPGRPTPTPASGHRNSGQQRYPRGGGRQAHGIHRMPIPPPPPN